MIDYFLIEASQFIEVGTRHRSVKVLGEHELGGTITKPLGKLNLPPAINPFERPHQRMGRATQQEISV